MRFLQFVPGFEQSIVDSDVILIKYWLDTSMEVQDRRFRDRINDPRKTWKLSPMDVASYNKWYAYSAARDDMFMASDRDHAPWYIVPADDKKRARLNCISHFLSMIPYQDIQQPEVDLGERSMEGKYDDELDLGARHVVPQKY
jgi:polyphosphate kinase 2 (PPK2 family)